MGCCTEKEMKPRPERREPTNDNATADSPPPSPSKQHDQESVNNAEKVEELQLHVETSAADALVIIAEEQRSAARRYFVDTIVSSSIPLVALASQAEPTARTAIDNDEAATRCALATAIDNFFLPRLKNSIGAQLLFAVYPAASSITITDVLPSWDLSDITCQTFAGVVLGAPLPSPARMIQLCETKRERKKKKKQHMTELVVVPSNTTTETTASATVSTSSRLSALHSPPRIKRSLGTRSVLHSLELHGLGGRVSISFAAFPPTLRSINLRDNQIAGFLDHALFSVIGKQLPNLQFLDLSMNLYVVPDDDGIDLAPLAHLLCIEEISLAHQQEQRERATSPASNRFRFSTIPPSLLRLNLSALALTGDIAADVLDQIPPQSKLTTLLLASNRFAGMLSNPAQFPGKLEFLSLEGNGGVSCLR